MMRQFATFGFLAFLLAVLGVSIAVDGAPPPKKATGNDAVLYWNEIALQAVADDHSGIFGAPEQGGPTRTSRALAIVHIAMYDAVNAIDGSYEPYLEVGLPASVIAKAAIDAAVAQAAHDTLAELYPNQAPGFARELRLALNGVPANRGRSEGVEVGAKAASNVLALREDDGANEGDDPIGGYPETTGAPGEHQPDPLNPDQGLLTPGWGAVDSFSRLDVTAVDVRTKAPPALDSTEYARDLLEVSILGGDGVTTQTLRTKEETEIGLFWAYDGAKYLGTPPRLYNQIVRVIAQQQKNTVVENARLFALVNIAMGDAGIAAWDSKYYYNVWRPVVGIRRADEDGNGDTERDEEWTPLGAPATNQSGNNFTPPFPAYPSGHAAFGAAMFRILENFYGADDVSYRLTSDEMRGQTTDHDGKHRYTTIRRYDSFSQGALENARSRIYLGIHWQFDADAGVKQGRTVADHVFDNLLQAP